MNEDSFAFDGYKPKREIREHDADAERDALWDLEQEKKWRGEVKHVVPKAGNWEKSYYGRETVSHLDKGFKLPYSWMSAVF